eukprot:CAMPEP_0171094140 /NCGR_PEP_ID=MMETSP0766_2-20121228/40076_1 /TAXON_ID=439317 /ORGANISM="Gambierdiscus australes, Strain CAWD 149" /LENGTH=70 /DNA_ID=CAMNT_0011552711 /DNA_START=17 /DNA_END=226 /DNA_ORIENTATION=+
MAQGGGGGGSAKAWWEAPRKRKTVLRLWCQSPGSNTQNHRAQQAAKKQLISDATRLKNRIPGQLCRSSPP